MKRKAKETVVVQGVEPSELNKIFSGYQLRSQFDIHKKGLNRPLHMALIKGVLKDPWHAAMAAQEAMLAGPQLMNNLPENAHRHVLYLCKMGLVHHAQRKMH